MISNHTLYQASSWFYTFCRFKIFIYFQFSYYFFNFEIYNIILSISPFFQTLPYIPACSLSNSFSSLIVVTYIHICIYTHICVCMYVQPAHYVTWMPICMSGLIIWYQINSLCALPGEGYFPYLQYFLVCRAEPLRTFLCLFQHVYLVLVQLMLCQACW